MFLNEKATTDEMFTAMLASVGITSRAGITDETETALLEEVETFAVEQGYFFDADKEVYTSNDSALGSWVR